MRPAAAALLLVAGASVHAQPVGFRAFNDSHDPPTFQQLDGGSQSRFDLGHAVFNTQWVTAGTPDAARRDGVGPLFNAAACDECHNEGARGRGPVGDGRAPLAMVVQLESPRGAGAGADPGLVSAGDPRYGHVLNTAAVDGLAPEGTITIHYQERHGVYPDGNTWTLRVPSYQFSDLRYGAMAPDTVLKPRLAPALFGVGLLDAVPQAALTHGSGRIAWQWYNGHRLPGRFGWQASAVSVRDQTTRAFAREMGLTSDDVSADDCTSEQPDCLGRMNGGTPEVTTELLDAVLEFQRWLAVPTGTAASGVPHPLFVQAGCTACHQPTQPIELAGVASAHDTIAPYTDLRVHDMGGGLADRNVAGKIIPSSLRTAPLWGLGYRLRIEHVPTFLHDGRARSIEEAILWHDGEAREARRRFEQLSAQDRQALLTWLAGL
jgi:CxxC motif-containing protein (DUF1111 family)